jgi:putative tryptophan/tyrosine transport system substrate-binding protein
MDRRAARLALVMCALAVVGSFALAQPARHPAPARIAILDDATQASRAKLWDEFRERLGALGYAVGSDIVVERRFADGNAERLPALAAEIVASNPDIIVTVSTTAALAASKATSRIPIVALGPADPVKSGLVTSLGRPGGNVTGTSPNQFEIAGKWLELVREIAPRAKSLAYLTDPGNPGEMLVFLELQRRARALGLEARLMSGLTKVQIEEGFASMNRDGVDALVVATTAALLAHRDQIVASASRLRGPSVYARREYAEAGGLIAYGADPAAPFVRGAEYVDRILKGARPADLPFEMASTFTLVVNLKTARALGITVPRALMARADELIR